MGLEKNISRAEQLQRAIMAYVLEEVSRTGSLREQYAHIASFGVTVERLVELAECRELITLVDLEALGCMLNVTVGQLLVRAQRELLRAAADPVPFPRPQVRHE